MTSFGTATKDFPILEFNPANKAYQDTSSIGFRTFVNVTYSDYSDAKTEVFEPFSSLTAGEHKRVMYVGSNEVEIKETNSQTNLETSVTYFTLPEEDFGALVRRMTIKNTGKQTVKIQVLDGLAKMEPAGGPLDGQLKNMGRTLEGWMDVHQASPSEKDLTMPYYKLSTQPSDTASVKVQVEGHYCIAMIDRGEEPSPLLPVIFDTDKVFGQDTSFAKPQGFFGKSVGDLLSSKQSGAAKTSSAFAALKLTKLKPGESITISSYYGKAPQIETVPAYARTVTAPGYTLSKFKRARTMIEELTSSVTTTTADPLFNGHIKQMFLDNALRGGIPMILGDTEGEKAGRRDADEDSRLKVYHAFSRIHGDLERDYNAFSIDPTFFSQGPGNYRDVAQNRRMDVMFNPRIGAFDVKQFLSFIQADGYEPLTVEAVKFTIESRPEAETLATWAIGEGDGFKGPRDALISIFKGGSLRPGQLFQLMEEQDINLKPHVTRQEFIDRFAAAASMEYSATFGDGYWADHWEYYLDMIDSYLAVYPEREEQLMFDSEPLPYFYAPATCQPRDLKYVLTPTFDGEGKHVQQLGAMVWDAEKTEKQNKYLHTDTPWLSPDANFQHDKDGNVFKSSPIAKLLLLAVQKFSMRDPYGMGVEYEGGKPGWNDAMNGLVGMLGSGMPEAYELQLLLRYVERTISKYKRDVEVPSELGIMISSIEAALDSLEDSNFQDEDLSIIDSAVPTPLYDYWDSVATAREKYRKDVRFHFSGGTATLSSSTITSTLKRFIYHTDLGLDRAMKVSSEGDGDNGSSGVAPTYFSYEVTSYEETGGYDVNEQPYVKALGFEVGVFPLFLEGPVRMMKTLPASSYEEQKAVYDKVKASGLYDSGLNSFTVSASLVGQSFDMGRMMAFSPGWLENQSIWTHMSYKFYLQLIRGKLYDVFFSELKGGGMLPFNDPLVYGRSLMECSSFVASSAFPDDKQHGRGFLARLSGSTAEFLSMWTLMFIGPTPFEVDNTTGQLKFSFSPALPEWVFDEKSTVSFKLFSDIKVTFHNSRGGAIRGERPVRYEVHYKLGGGQETVEGRYLRADIAEKLRRLDVDRVEAWW